VTGETARMNNDHARILRIINAAALPPGHQQEQYRNVDVVEPRARSRLFFSKSFEATRQEAGTDIAAIETLMSYI
jgi:hypothetical protein